MVLGRFKDFKRQDFAGGRGSLGMVEEDGGRGLLRFYGPAPFPQLSVSRQQVPLTSWPSTPITVPPPILECVPQHCDPG